MKKQFLSLIPHAFYLLLLTVTFTACNPFGSEIKIKKSSVFYKDIPKEQAQKVGDYLYNIGYFQDENDISVQVTKPKDTLQLRFVVDKSKVQPDVFEQYLMIVSDLSDSVFNKAPIVVFLADTEMKDLQRVGVASGTSATNAGNEAEIEAILKATEERASQIGSNVKDSKGNKLYYDNNVEPDKVNALVSYLTEGGYFEETAGHIAVITKQNGTYVYKEAFTDEQIADKGTTDALEAVANSIKQDVFTNDKFTFEVCNLNFQKQKSFTPASK